MSARCWVEVDLDAIRHNIRILKSRAGNALFMAVVKADGYGYGALEIARTALGSGALWLGVATLDEALEIRSAGIPCPVLVLGWTDPRRFGEAVMNMITLTLTSLRDAELLAAAGLRASRAARGHLKVDTGMGRLGVTPDASGAEVFFGASRLEGLEVGGVFTHFAEADVPDSPYTDIQIKRFNEFLDRLGDAAKGVIRHAANTGGILYHPASHFDLVRAGIGMYGYAPDGVSTDKSGLKPAMTWKAQVAQVKSVPAGTTLSYGRTFQMPGDGVVATLGVGYADGYSRTLSGKAHVILGGRRVPVAGRICMDQMMVLPETEVRPGDVAVLMGEEGGVSVSCEEIARSRDTLVHEVICGISRRVKRVYTGECAGRAHNDREREVL